LGTFYVIIEKRGLFPIFDGFQPKTHKSPQNNHFDPKTEKSSKKAVL